MYPENRNTVLGAGYLHFNQLIAGTSRYRGDLYIANTERLALTVTPGGRVTDYDADGEIATLNLDIDTQVERTVQFVTKHISNEALELFLGGTKAVTNGPAASHTDSVINGGFACSKGYWYQLGKVEYKAGARYVSAVTIRTVETTPVPLVEDTHYTLDAANGRFYMLPSGSLTNKILEADFTVAGSAGSVLQVSSPLHKRIRGELTFISANTAGTERAWIWHDCILSPEGPLDLKSRDQVQRLTFNARVQQPETGPAMTVVYGGNFGS